MNEVVSLSGTVIEPDDLFSDKINKTILHYDTINGNPINNVIRYDFSRIFLSGKPIIMKKISDSSLSVDYFVRFNVINEQTHKLTVEGTFNPSIDIGSRVIIELVDNKDEDEDDLPDPFENVDSDYDDSDSDSDERDLNPVGFHPLFKKKSEKVAKSNKKVTKKRSTSKRGNPKRSKTKRGNPKRSKSKTKKRSKSKTKKRSKSKKVSKY